MELATVFADLEPVPQDDGTEPVCAIDYPSDFVEAMDYFRAVLLSQEYSSRSLSLTSICLKYNPANYTVWHFRRECLKALSSSTGNTIDEDLAIKDLEFSESLGGSNPKNYQIWYHRRSLLETLLKNMEIDSPQKFSKDLQKQALNVTLKELTYTSNVLQEDAKNYHAFSHRQWLLRYSINHISDPLWEEELHYADSLLQDDIRNNSAWNHRWFIIHKGCAAPLSIDVAHTEAEYALDAAQRDPWNESSWSYFSGIVKEQLRSSITKKSEKNELLAMYETRIKNIEPKEEKCVNIISTRVFLLESQGNLDALRSAVDLANDLALEQDKIRRKYWLYKQKELRAMIDKAISS